MQARERKESRKNIVFFPMFCGSGQSKSSLPKAAGAEPAGEMRDEKCTPLWREARLQVKSEKALGNMSLFWCVKFEFVDR